MVHLAAYYDFFGTPSPKYDEITVQGTARLLRQLRAQDFQVEQSVFSSTMVVHRPGEPGEFITEEWPIEPTWAYPESHMGYPGMMHAPGTGIGSGTTEPGMTGPGMGSMPHGTTPSPPGDGTR